MRGTADVLLHKVAQFLLVPNAVSSRVVFRQKADLATVDAFKEKPVVSHYQRLCVVPVTVP